MPITFPPVLSHRAADVYPDTVNPNLFYLIPNVPTLRRDGGVPVFRGMFWTDRADGAAGSVAGMAGAQLNFDVNLVVSPEDQEDIRRQIKDSGVQEQRVAAMLREERERLDRMARATGTAAPAPDVPAVAGIVFGSVPFSDGRVVLLEKQGDDVVEWSSSGGAPSLMGTENTAFAMRLGATGAAVWYKALEADATAIGVRYELEFPVTLPSLEIHVWAGSYEKLELTRKVDRVITNMDQGCSDADVEHIDVKEVSEHLSQEGLVHIEITKGLAKISDEVVAQLRETALNLISERVKQVLMSRIRGMTEEERRTGLQTKVEEELHAFAELRLTQTDVITWKVNPQATMTEFLGGITGEERTSLVTLVDLSNPVVATLEVPVTVSADWDADPKITRVDVAVSYPAAPFEDEKVMEVSLAKGSDAATLRWRRDRGDRGTLEYVATAYVLGSSTPVPIATGTTNGPVHVEVPELGKFEIRVRPYAEDFALKGSGKIEAVELDYSYGAESDGDHVASSVVLRATDAEQGVLLSHRVDGAIRGPVRVVPRYIFAEGGSIPGTEVKAWVRAGDAFRMDVPSAWPDKLQVGARVRPGVPGLTAVDVRLEHRDEARGFESEASILLDADVDWEGRTTLPQADPTHRAFRYRYSVRGVDQLENSPWIDAEGDGELPVLPVLPVQVRPASLGLGTRFSDVVLRLAFRDADRDWEVRHEMFLTDATTVPVWLVPRASGLLDRFRYSMTLTTLDGHVVEVPEAEGHGENLVLRAPN